MTEAGQQSTAELMDYFGQLDAALCRHLTGAESLVLATLAQLAPLYRQANHYPHLQAQVIAGNPEPAHPQRIAPPRLGNRAAPVFGAEQLEMEWKADVLRAGAADGLEGSRPPLAKDVSRNCSWFPARCIGAVSIRMKASACRPGRANAARRRPRESGRHRDATARRLCFSCRSGRRGR